MALLECVPNISEGRRDEVIGGIAAQVQATRGVSLLDVSVDPDHNRSVLTLVGETEILVTALLALYEEALAVLELGRHRGVHPRLGVVDVVPFVPLGASRMADAVRAARSLGAQVAERFALPVFLYENAAQRPERRNLADLRRGGLTGLAHRMEQPDGAPDFGPRHLHPTGGATVIGARFFLIAFNVLLQTDDVEVAERIARSVRESSGGLPAVKAIGVFLESRSRAQVSLNLVDYRQTSMTRALRQVRDEASACGTQVLSTEIVGMVPEEAILGSVVDCLGLEQPPKLLRPPSANHRDDS